MKDIATHKIFAIAISVLSLTTFAATPFVTVSWNGHRAAVSFTFDDGLANQAQNLKPILDTMPEARVTFFIAGNSMLLQDAKGFAALANAGHEIGNHGYSHQNLPTVTDPDELNREIVQSASDIESTMASAGAKVRITSFATPFCASNDDVISVIGSRHFINRNCGWHGRVNWSSATDVFTLGAKGWDRSLETAESMCAALDTASLLVDVSSMESWLRPGSEGSWIVVLTHGVADDGDALSVNPRDMETIIRHALDNDMWVTTFSTAGAYFLAHRILDTTSAAKSESGYSASWELPHSNMPESIPLKVSLNEVFLAETGWPNDAVIVLEQNGQLLWPDEQNQYILEFASKNVLVRTATQAEIEAHNLSGIDEDDGKSGNKDDDKAIILPRSLPVGLGLPKQYYDLKGRAISTSKKNHMIRVKK